MNYSVIGEGHPSPVAAPAESMVCMMGPTGYVIISTVSEPLQYEIEEWRTARLEIRARAYESYTHMTVSLNNRLRGEVYPTALEFDPLPTDPGEGYGTPINLLLVDAATNLCVAQRTCALSRRISLYLINSWLQNKQSDMRTYQRQTSYGRSQPVQWHHDRAIERMVWEAKQK